MHSLPHLHAPAHKQPLPTWAAVAYLTVVVLLIGTLSGMYVSRNDAARITPGNADAAVNASPLTNAEPGSSPRADEPEVTGASIGPSGELELERHVERFALNALLVPLIDDAEHPPRWRHPATTMKCGEASRVDIDGRPLRPGAEQSGRSFGVQWMLDDCAPFGPDGLTLLSGRAQLDVFREDDGLAANVRLLNLRVRRNGLTATMNNTFVAHTP